MRALDFLFDVGIWSFEGLWLPLLVWTVLALPSAVLLVYGRPFAVHVRYGAVFALLSALPVGLLTAQLLPPGGETGSPLGWISLPAIVVEPDAVMRADARLAWTTVHSAGLLFVVATLAALWRTSLLIVGFVGLRALRKILSSRVDPRLQDLAAPLAARLGISRRVHVTHSPKAGTPMTFGWLRPVVVLPRRLTRDPGDLRLALIHELIHIRRHDYAVLWFEQIVGALFFIHPLVAVLRREASLLRETSCDVDVVSLAGHRARYARLLYDFSTSGRSPWKMAVGISLQENHLRRRITAMKDSTDFSRLSSAKRIGLILAAVIFATSALVVACSDNFVATDPEATDPQSIDTALEGAAQDEDVYVIVENMPELVGGLQSIQQNLSYPELAAKAGIEGRVIVQFVVDEEGAVRNPTIVRGVGAGLDAAALKAVEAAKFLPGKQGGEPVKVKMSLPITFKLPNSSETSEDTAIGENRANVDRIREAIERLRAQVRSRYPTRLAPIQISATTETVTAPGSAR